MKRTIGIYNEKAKLSYKIRNVITPCLGGLELFLKNIKTKIPDSFTTIIENLKKFYEKIENYNVSLNNDYEILNQYPEILNGSKNHVLSLVNYSKYNPASIDEDIEIDAKDLVRAFTHFEYFFMISLLKIMSREEAIEYIKKLSDEIAHSRKDPNNYVESFKESLDRYKNNLARWQMQESIAGPLVGNRLLYKVKKCEWAETLKDFDLELCYAINCYQDFEGTKNLNPNFILTRTKTILMGEDYCDFCYHDLSHPSPNEFEDLG